MLVTSAGMPRFFSSPLRLVSSGVILTLAVFLAVPSGAAVADPLVTKDACVINKLVDGPVAGGSQCAGANLARAKLVQAALQGADLTGANLSGADLQGSSLLGAKVAGADFSGARIISADFTGTDILPAKIEVVSPTVDGVPVEFQPVVPKGLTMQGCTVAGVPVESGAIFPVGQSAIVCLLVSSRSADDIATAVVKISVTTPDTTPIVPVFTEPPATPRSSAQTPLPPATVMIILIGGGLLLLIGILAVVASVIRSRRGF